MEWDEYKETYQAFAGGLGMLLIIYWGWKIGGGWGLLLGFIVSPIAYYVSLVLLPFAIVLLPFALIAIIIEMWKWALFVICMLVLVFIILCLIRVLYKRFTFFNLRFSVTVVDPDIIRQCWRTQFGPTCAINVQRIILEIFGINKTEKELSDRQRAFGKYDRLV